MTGVVRGPEKAARLEGWGVRPLIGDLREPGSSFVTRADEVYREWLEAAPAPAVPA